MRNKLAFSFALASALLLLAGPVFAHHGRSGYDNSKTLTLKATITEFEWSNPHVQIHFDAPDDKGVMQRWAVEWGSGMMLSTQGLSATTLKAGDHVIVVGSPGRDPDDHRLRMRSIERPKDGFKWNGTFQ